MFYVVVIYLKVIIYPGLDIMKYVLSTFSNFNCHQLYTNPSCANCKLIPREWLITNRTLLCCLFWLAVRCAPPARHSLIPVVRWTYSGICVWQMAQSIWPAGALNSISLSRTGACTFMFYAVIGVVFCLCEQYNQQSAAIPLVIQFSSTESNVLITSYVHSRNAGYQQHNHSCREDGKKG